MGTTLARLCDLRSGCPRIQLREEDPLQGFVKDLLPGDQPRGWGDRGKGIPGTAEQKVASTLLHRRAQKLSSVETFLYPHLSGIGSEPPGGKVGGLECFRLRCGEAKVTHHSRDQGFSWDMGL